jgi:hypothetical protein
MKLYDVEQSAQEGIADAGEQYTNSKSKKSFEGFKV